jgi:hypothetical protein
LIEKGMEKEYEMIELLLALGELKVMIDTGVEEEDLCVVDDKG